MTAAVTTLAWRAPMDPSSQTDTGALLDRLHALEGVPSALAAARDGIDAVLRDRGLRRTAPGRDGGVAAARRAGECGAGGVAVDAGGGPVGCR